MFSYDGKTLALKDRADMLGYRSQYTVAFDADGGNPAAQKLATEFGMTAGDSNMPSEPAKSGCVFGGWYTGQNGGGSEFTGSIPVIANVTVYAKWAAVYTITFNADGGLAGGHADGEARTVVSGGTVGASNMPSEPAKSGYIFGGWYAGQSGGGGEFTGSTAVTANMAVYARWVVQAPSGLTLEESLAWISSNAEEGGVYAVTLRNNESISPKTLSYGGKNVSVTLEGGTSGRTVSLSAAGSLFTVESGVTLTLGGNVTLQGWAGNTASLVRVSSGGTLVMNAGSIISGNSASSFGGGVYVGGTFIMSGGKISGNTAASSFSSFGGGVYIDSGTFAMSGGKISGNSASSFGGGVYVDNGTFAMSGGKISGNSASSDGGGVYVDSGTFTMEGGEISGNSASSDGGGGAYVDSGTFTMSGGEISGNSASSDASFSSYGGGVYVDSGTFAKQSGAVIYGSGASSGLKNTAGSKKRNTTAGTGVTLDSDVRGSAGGWE